MSTCPKDKHKALLYRVRRARKFAESTNQAMGRLWRELRDAAEASAAPKEGPDLRDEVSKAIAAGLERWKKSVSEDGWSGVWEPAEIKTVLEIVAAAAPPARRRKRRR